MVSILSGYPDSLCSQTEHHKTLILSECESSSLLRSPDCCGVWSSTKSLVLRSLVFYKVMRVVTFGLLRSPESCDVWPSMKSWVLWYLVFHKVLYPAGSHFSDPIPLRDYDKVQLPPGRPMASWLRENSVGILGSLTVGLHFQWMWGFWGLPQHSFSP